MKKFDIEKGQARHDEGITYKHPSYGLVKISRNSGKSECYGSDLTNTSCFEFDIYSSEQTNMLGKNWYNGNKKIMSFKMTASQFVELMTSVNYPGIPCTIKYHPEHGNIEYAPPPTQLDYASGYVHESANRSKRLSASLKKRAEELLKGTGTLKKADKDELLSLLTQLSNAVGPDMDFAVDQAEEAIDHMKSQAYSEISSRLDNIIIKTGLETLRNDGFLEGPKGE